MDLMRADMGGAACVLSSVWAAAQLKLPLNIRAYMPLCENMPSGERLGLTTSQTRSFYSVMIAHWENECISLSIFFVAQV